MSQMVIGLTGGIGSGKTTVANIFAEYNIDIIDADIVARQVVEPGTPALEKIAAHFGDEYILPDGNMDRSKIRHRVFANTDDKQWLNNLLHPLIRDEMSRQCTQAQSPYCLLVAPLLIENGINNTVDKVLVIDVKPETQIERTVKRDDNSKEQVEKILAAQISRDARLKHADFVISNESQNKDNLIEQVELIHRKLLKLALK